MRNAENVVYIKVTDDPYELIVEMGDTLKELAIRCNLKEQSIARRMWRAKKDGKNCIYKKVVIED